MRPDLGAWRGGAIREGWPGAQPRFMRAAVPPRKAHAGLDLAGLPTDTQLKSLNRVNKQAIMIKRSMTKITVIHIRAEFRYHRPVGT